MHASPSAVTLWRHTPFSSQLLLWRALVSATAPGGHVESNKPNVWTGAPGPGPLQLPILWTTPQSVEHGSRPLARGWSEHILSDDCLPEDGRQYAICLVSWLIEREVWHTLIWSRSNYALHTYTDLAVSRAPVCPLALTGQTDLRWEWAIQSPCTAHCRPQVSIAPLGFVKKLLIRLHARAMASRFDWATAVGCIDSMQL